MEKFPKWNNNNIPIELCLILVWSIGANGFPKQVAAENEVTYRDYISIDCGANEAYTDSETNIHYQPDSGFIETGQNHILPSSEDDSFEGFSKQLNTLRSFPDGDRNCYVLAPKQGRDHKYIVRAFFAYGNYDMKNTVPRFDIYVGVNRWKRVEPSTTYSYFSIEVVHYALTDTISVCLVNIQEGVPFISSLELWLLDDAIYEVEASKPQDLMTRRDLGLSENLSFIRYKDDMYGRVWFQRYNIKSSETINTSAAIDANAKESIYKLPPEVLKTAVQSVTVTLDSSLEIYLDTTINKAFEYFVYLHFFEFEHQAQTQKRNMNVTINDVSIFTEPFNPPYLKPVPIVRNISQADYLKILINSTSQSDLPAMINAFEIYRVLPQPKSPTFQKDADAILSIKHVYKIPRIDWQGDPCVPTVFTWEGLTCSSDENPRIISLNLSSSRLTGKIDASFSRLINLESLDLSNNKLTGEVPEVFAELPKLKVLNLAGNQLTGSIPKSLKSNTNLLLSLEGNPGLCPTASCEKKSHVPLIASIAASIAVLVLIVFISVILWRVKKKKQGASKKDGQGKSKNQEFSYSEVTRITNNFKTVIGKGGFGEVYHGTLQDGREVAVKLLSQTSNQGYMEFQSEANLLTIVHHRNLVSLVGYCDEGDVKALVYEYMPNGNLQQLLSDKNPNVLKWCERLQIAADAAHGLDYLHNGCKPPTVHRDLKTANILLNEKMQAKISDFGLSRTFANESDSHLSTIPAGTMGYLDPEFYSSGNLNKKSDVYSFGIILLELITGQPAIKSASYGNFSHILHHWVNPKLKNGDIESIVDPRLQGQYNTNSAWKFVEIAMSCTPPTAIQRPDISHVVTELKDCLALEINLERAESSRIKYSNSLDISSSNSSQIESTRGPNVR